MLDFSLAGCIWQELMNCYALHVLSTGEHLQEGAWKECRHKITLLQEIYSHNANAGNYYILMIPIRSS